MTPAVTAAQKAGVFYKTHAYKHDPKAESYGTEAAEKLNLPEERVFKTLIASLQIGGREVLAVAVVPVCAMLDLKKFATTLGGKKAEMADKAAAQRTTGYLLGGISPLGQKRKLPCVIDASATVFETVYVSAGRRGLEIELAPADLLRLTDALSKPIAVV